MADSDNWLPLLVGDRVQILKAVPGATGAEGVIGIVTLDPSTNGLGREYNNNYSEFVRVRCDLTDKVWAVGKVKDIKFRVINSATETKPKSVLKANLKKSPVTLTMDADGNVAEERALGEDPDDQDLSAPPVYYPGTPTEQKPMVTRDQYDRARAVLDALPPGLYVKCSKCGDWQHGGTYAVHAGGTQIICEKCRG